MVEVWQILHRWGRTRTLRKHLSTLLGTPGILKWDQPSLQYPACRLQRSVEIHVAHRYQVFLSSNQRQIKTWVTHQKPHKEHAWYVDTVDYSTTITIVLIEVASGWVYESWLAIRSGLAAFSTGLPRVNDNPPFAGYPVWGFFVMKLHRHGTSGCECSFEWGG